MGAKEHSAQLRDFLNSVGGARDLVCTEVLRFRMRHLEILDHEISLRAAGRSVYAMRDYLHAYMHQAGFAAQKQAPPEIRESFRDLRKHYRGKREGLECVPRGEFVRLPMLFHVRLCRLFHEQQLLENASEVHGSGLIVVRPLPETMHGWLAELRHMEGRIASVAVQKTWCAADVVHSA